MSPELFKEMQTDTREFGGLGIEIGMEAGVVKVISPMMILHSAGIKAFIVKIGKDDTRNL